MECYHLSYSHIVMVLFFCGSLSEVASKSDYECGNTYQYDEGSKLCYSLQTEPLMLTWDDAEDKCKDLGGHLASPSTQSKHDAVLNIISEAKLEKEDVWIGLWHESGAQLSHPKQGWRWLDNSPYKFMAWGGNEPNDKEKYARMNEGTWKGILQAPYKYFLCQKEPIETPTPQPVTEPNQPMKSPVPIYPTIAMGPSDKPTSDGNENTLKGNMTSTDILGPVLGTAIGVVLVVLTVNVVLFKRRRISGMHCWKKCPCFKEPEEHYSDINENDLDPARKSSPAIYYNDIASRGHPVSRENLHDQPSGSEYYNDTPNYEYPVGKDVPKETPVSTYTQLQ